MDSAKSIDIITIGRALVDLYGEQVGGRLEDMLSFSKYVGGCPSNIAIGTARLGLKSAIFTRVGNDHMGRYIREEMQKEGVDTSGIAVDNDRLTALVLLGIRDQETFPLVFYRENCADMALTEDDIQEELIAKARVVLVTGTHLSTESTRAASKKAIALAKKHGAKVVFDVDYRPVLWGLTSKENGEDRFIANDDVTSYLKEIAPDCDLIVGTEEELHILGGSLDTPEAIRHIRSVSDAEIVCKLGERGCAYFGKTQSPNSLNDGVYGEKFSIEVFNVLGAGDAFMNGFLLGWLNGESPETCCTYGNACGAITVSRHACSAANATRTELDHFMKTGVTTKALRKDKKLENLHWSTTRKTDYPLLQILAVDHRSQLEDVANDTGKGSADISAFKALALKAAEEAAGDSTASGILLDGRYSARVLEQAIDTPYWIGRAIEIPGSRPLDFDTDHDDIGMEINEWPERHVVKCLCFYHPDDSDELKQQQEKQVLRLFDACRNTRHEFLLEIICSKHGEVGTRTTADVMQRFYDIGVYPDWWKLEPSFESETWDNISATIDANDPNCRGILLLGLSAPVKELVDSFKVSVKCSHIKGFAVGRTIFHEAALAWFSDTIDDEQAIALMKEKYQTLMTGWTDALKSLEEQEKTEASNIRKAV